MTCPFCKRGDPFHRSDSGEALAVVCCDMGDMIFRGARRACATFFKRGNAERLPILEGRWQ